MLRIARCRFSRGWFLTVACKVDLMVWFLSESTDHSSVSSARIACPRLRGDALIVPAALRLVLNESGARGMFLLYFPETVFEQREGWIAGGSTAKFMQLQDL